MNKILSTKKGKIILFVAFILVIALVFAVTNMGGDTLTDKEIQSLRTTYPVCGKEIPVGMDMIKPTLEETIEGVDCFVYGEVIGETFYTQTTSTGIEELDEKLIDEEIPLENCFFEYTVKVIDDTEGLYQKGDTVKLKANYIFRDYNPNLENGMKIVVPVVASDDGRCDYNVVGMYYVTDNDYAISAFDETSTTTKAISGIKINTLLEKLKK